MGSCISKCKPKRKPHQENDQNVQDKLVISQSPQFPPPPTTIQSPEKQKTTSPPPLSLTPSPVLLAPPPISLAPPVLLAPAPPHPPLGSTSPFSSFTCSTQNSSSSSSLSSSSSASSTCSSSLVAFSKIDRSFTNEFLLSCAKENPRIIRLDPTKPRALKQSPTQKRARASSPTLVRQKSLKTEKEKVANPIVNGRNVMRSPSPSRRFDGYTKNYQKPANFSTNKHNESNICKNFVTRKENARPMSPNRKMMIKERFVGHENGVKVDDFEVGKMMGNMNYSSDVPMEDLDNPHIALDCFIFL